MRRGIIDLSVKGRRILHQLYRILQDICAGEATKGSNPLEKETEINLVCGLFSLLFRGLLTLNYFAQNHAMC